MIGRLSGISADSIAGLEVPQSADRRPMSGRCSRCSGGIARLPVDASTIEKNREGIGKTKTWPETCRLETDDQPTTPIILRSSPENDIFAQKPIGSASEPLCDIGLSVPTYIDEETIAHYVNKLSISNPYKICNCYNLWMEDRVKHTGISNQKRLCKSVGGDFQSLLGD